MSFVKTGNCAIVEKNIKISTKVCNICGSEYNSELEECPNCSSNKKS